MILATEMTKHFEHLAKFMNVCSARIGDGQVEVVYVVVSTPIYYIFTFYVYH